MDKEAKEVLVVFSSALFIFLFFLFFLKLVNVMFFPPMQNVDIKNKFVELKKQRETLDEIKKQNEEIIKLLSK